MIANDWIVIQRARAHREGLRRGIFLAVLPAALIGVGIMLAVHVGLSVYADRKHDEVVRLLNTELRTCRADVTRYQEVADIEKAYAERKPGR